MAVRHEHCLCGTGADYATVSQLPKYNKNELLFATTRRPMHLLLFVFQTETLPKQLLQSLGIPAAHWEPRTLQRPSIQIKRTDHSRTALSNSICHNVCISLHVFVIREKM